MSNFFMYAGYSDPPQGAHAPAWKLFAATEAGKTDAVNQGYTALSTMSFSHPSIEGNDEPVRKGDLIMDFDCKEDPVKAIKLAQSFLKLLNLKYGLDLTCLRYWLSGGKGCHIAIPAECYGGEDGDQYLPDIHKFMLMFMERRCFKAIDAMGKILDRQLYNMGKGKLLRLENIKRENGRYKVPLTSQEFFQLDETKICELPKKPRTLQDEAARPVLSQALKELYFTCKELGHLKHDPKFRNFQLDKLWSCEFIAHCFTEQENLSEPEWWALIKNLLPFGEAGRTLIHEFSRGYSKYSWEATEQKIQSASQKDIPISCQYITSELGFKCDALLNGDCRVGAPACIWKGTYQKEYDKKDKFVLEETGVYFRDENGVVRDKVCSWIKVLAKARNPDGQSWGRWLEVKKPDSIHSNIFISMPDVYSVEKLKSILCNEGVEIEFYPKAISLVQEYINGSSLLPNAILVEKTGWLSVNNYVLPDRIFGLSDEKIIFTQDAPATHKCIGSIEEWQENVGRYCQGNSLLVFGTSYALTGPLLAITGMEGGGIHLYGCSSQGKTSSSVIIGSVCGGDANKGYIQQWRTTDNALEYIAVMHNDNLLILDEISQATSETIYNAAYMLANGQGKTRMKSDASPRYTHKWRLNFLSNGEVAFTDKIEEEGKLKSKAGQEIRVIDLPIDGGKCLQPITSLHGFSEKGTFMDTVRKNACIYYGAPLRAFLEKLCAGGEEVQKQIREMAEKYARDWCPEGAGSQVQRVAKKFALIAVAGELATRWEIFPYEHEEAVKTVKEWFLLWVTEKHGLENAEIQKTLDDIRTFFEACYTMSGDGYRRGTVLIHSGRGYGKPVEVGKIVDEGQYFIRAHMVSELIKGVNRQDIIEKLVKLGWIAATSPGHVRESVSFNGVNSKGLVFYINKILE